MLSSPQYTPLIFPAILFVVLIIAASALSQTPSVTPLFVGTCIDSDQGPRPVVRSVKIIARWAPDMDLPLKPNDRFTPLKIRETRLAFLKAMVSEKNEYNAASIGLGKLPIVDVRYVRVCGRVVFEKDCLKAGFEKNCVDVEIRPFALSTDPAFLASVFLPLPRSNKFSFLSNVSRPVLLFNPKFSLDRDGTMGTTPGFEISTDLFTFGKVVQGDPTEARKSSLMFAAKGSKSIGKVFYNSQAKLSLNIREPNERIESVGLDTAFSSDVEPQRDVVFHRNTFRAGGHISFTPDLGFVNKIALSGGYRRSQNNLTSNGAAPRISTSENSFEGRAIIDGRIANGFSRFAFWFEGGRPGATSLYNKFYKRFAALIGYQKEIPVSGHTIGIETLFGAGWASSNTPEYALFYGGNSLNDFLYEEPNAASFSSLPPGPVMRSFGKNQAGLPASLNRQLGASRYQHLNLTVSIPIPGFSKPLIPDEVINENPRITLRSVVDFALNTGEESLSLNLQDEGLSEEEADRQAAKVFRGIRPGVRFLTNYAKVYAIKPILMLDASSMARQGFASRISYGVGGGVQLTIAVTKFEMGYVHNIHRITGDSRGNFLARLIFQNLF